MRAEEMGRLAQALTSLPEDQQRAIELHHLAGSTVAEVGVQMGRSRPAVVGLLFRGMKRLRELLQNDLELFLGERDRLDSLGQ